MFPSRSLCSPSTSLVREALHANGPQTTRTLYNILTAQSSTSQTPLPPKPLPANFLQGRRRILATREDAERLAAKRRAAEDSNASENTWSMRYLKTKVLGGMAERGEVIKLTRARWEKLSTGSTGSATSASTSGAAATERPAAQTAATASATAAKEQSKHEEEHVWVTKGMLEEAVAASGRTFVRKPLRPDTGEAELRQTYGLRQEGSGEAQASA